MMMDNFGDGTTTAKNKLAEMQGLSDIVKIAAGENFALAVDNLGIVYKWGNGIVTPEVYQVGSQRIIDVSAGKNQSAFVTAKGTVFGEGAILSGQISGINNAVKTVVTDDSIIILTIEDDPLQPGTQVEKVYEYKAGVLSQIQIDDVIDISATNSSILYQTADILSRIFLDIPIFDDICVIVLVKIHNFYSKITFIGTARTHD